MTLVRFTFVRAAWLAARHVRRANVVTSSQMKTDTRFRFRAVLASLFGAIVPHEINVVHVSPVLLQGRWALRSVVAFVAVYPFHINVVPIRHVLTKRVRQFKPASTPRYTTRVGCDCQLSLLFVLCHVL